MVLGQFPRFYPIFHFLNNFSKPFRTTSAGRTLATPTATRMQPVKTRSEATFVSVGTVMKVKCAKMIPMNALLETFAESISTA